MQPKTRLIVHGIVNIKNSIVFITLLFRDNAWKLVFFMTILSFWFNMFYLMSTYIMDLRAYFTKKQALTFMPFMRDHYFKYAFSFSVIVVVGYYLLAIMGPTFLQTQTDFLGWALAIYLHGGVFCQMTMDLIILDHSYIPTLWKDITILAIIYMIYFVIALIALGLDVQPYKFMEFSSAPQLLVAFFIIFVLLVNSYYLYQWALRKKLGIVLDETVHIAKDSEDLHKQGSLNSSAASFATAMVTSDITKVI